MKAKYNTRGDGGSAFIPNGDGVSNKILASCDGSSCGGTCDECQAKGKTA